MIHTQPEMGLKPTAIAMELNRAASKRSRELRRNGWTRPTTRLVLADLQRQAAIVPSRPMRAPRPVRHPHVAHRVKLGFVEGLNNKIRVIQLRAYGYRDEEYIRLKILTASCRGNEQHSPTPICIEPPNIIWDTMRSLKRLWQGFQESS